MVPRHIDEWAKRFVCGNNSASIQQHLEKLANSGRKGSIMAVAIRNILDGEGAGRSFGHDAIGEDDLPIVNDKGFFIRGDSGWRRLDAEFESVVRYVLENRDFQCVIIDHVNNLYYASGKPILYSTHPYLRLCKGWIGNQAIWHAQCGPNEAWIIAGAQKSYVDYFDTVGGTEGKIRQDFVLSPSDIQAIVKAFLGDEEIADIYKRELLFLGFHPDLAEEYLSEFGLSNS